MLAYVASAYLIHKSRSRSALMTAFRRGARARLHSLLQLVGTRSAVTSSTRLEGTSLAAGCGCRATVGKSGEPVFALVWRIGARVKSGREPRTYPRKLMDASRITGVGDGGAEGQLAPKIAQHRLLLPDFTCSMRRRSTYTAEGDDAPDRGHAAVLDETGPSVTLAPWNLSSLQALLAHTLCLYGLAQKMLSEQDAVVSDLLREASQARQLYLLIAVMLNLAATLYVAPPPVHYVSRCTPDERIDLHSGCVE